MPSRMTFPPPNFTSSPYTVKSCSTSMMRSVSARRTLSPTVGPNIWAYASRFIAFGIFVPHSRQWSHDLLVEAVDEARTRIRHQRNFTRLAGLEAPCRPRRNLEPKTEGRLTIKCQSRVCFSEMVVTSHLYRSVASVSDR